MESLEKEIDLLKTKIYEPLLKVVLANFMLFTVGLFVNGYMFGRDGFQGFIFIGFVITLLISIAVFYPRMRKVIELEKQLSVSGE